MCLWCGNLSLVSVHLNDIQGKHSLVGQLLYLFYYMSWRTVSGSKTFHSDLITSKTHTHTHFISHKCLTQSFSAYQWLCIISVDQIMWFWRIHIRCRNLTALGDLNSQQLLKRANNVVNLLMWFSCHVPDHNNGHKIHIMTAIKWCPLAEYIYHIYLMTRSNIC